jgi:beta-lactam-binding protein with PASTA domain
MKSLLRFIFSRSFVINLFLLGIVSVTIFFAVKYFLESYTRHGETESIPHIIGYHETEVLPLLKDGAFSIVVNDSVYDPQLDGGTIVDQFPDSGSTVKAGRKIYVTIASYTTPMIPLPTVKGLTKRIAMAKLRSRGFIIDSLIYEPSTCTECVIAVRKDGEDIKAGQKLGKASHLVIVLGGGSEEQFVQTPALYGLYEEEVYALLEELGLNVDIVVHDNESYEKPEDSLQTKLYRQIPEFKEGDAIRLGTPVKLFFTAENNKIPKISIDSTKLFNAQSID